MSIRNFLQNLYYRVSIPFWQSQFQPTIEYVQIDEVNFKFFIGTPQAVDWYSPMKPHTLAEYQWVINNVNFEGQRVIDAGAHHGHYTMLFASVEPKPKSIVAVEPLSSNVVLLSVNVALNTAEVRIEQTAISTTKGTATFVPRSNGKLFQGVGIDVPTMVLHEIDPDANIIKLDIEGTEFNILPKEIDEMKFAHTWIVEVHSPYGDLSHLVNEFKSRGFTVSYLDKNDNTVKDADDLSQVTYSTSIFCVR